VVRQCAGLRRHPAVRARGDRGDGTPPSDRAGPVHPARRKPFREHRGAATPILRYGLAAILAFLPVFFANLVFTASFRDTRSADIAFASNVLGAVVGGCLEYLALVTGYRLLLLLVAALYAVAFLLTRWRIGGDRDLVTVAGAPGG